MTSSGGSVTVDVAGRDVNLVALLTRLEGQMHRTDQIGIQLSQTTGGTFTAAQTRAANAALSEAQAIARAAIAAGDDARAHTILVTALGQAAAAGDRNVASITGQISKLQQGSNAAQGFAGQLGQLNGALGALGIGLGAAQLVRATSELTTLGAQAQQTSARFDQLATQVGTTGEKMTAALRQASAGTISDTNLQLAAMKANLLGVGSTAEDLGPLLAIARDRAQQMGISTAFAFDSLVTGLGRGSRLILDNIGVIVKESEVNEAYAKSVGKSVSALTDMEKKQALINEVLRQGNDTLKATGGAINSNVTKMERYIAALDNLKAKIGGTFADVFGGAAEGATRLTGTMQEQATALDSLAQSRGSMTAGMLSQIPVFGQAIAAGLNEAGALNSSAQASVQAATAHQALITAIAGAAAATAAQAQASNTAALASQNLGAAFGAEAQAVTLATEAEAAHVVSVTGDAAKAQIATVASQELAVTKQSLAQQALLAANAMIASGNAGAATAGRLAASSSLVDQLTAAYLRLRAAQVAATGVALAVSSVSRSNSDAVDVHANKTAVLTGARAKDRAEAAAAADAERRYQQQLGNTAPALAHARAELAQLTQGSAAYIEKQIEIARLEKQSAKGGRAGGGAGAAKLSDQTKLNNTLLSDQERYQDQAENAERAHQQKLLDIQRDFAKRQLAQQKTNEISKRESELGFLESITGSELNKTKEGRAAIAKINERFYADFAEAQKAAQAGNAKQSEEMVALARERAAAEQRYAEAIDTAREEKNKAEVARQEALREKERQILDEKQKQIAEGGDANVNAKNEALAAEQASFEEQQGKNATAAEQAGQRKIDAAQRSGKAVTDENAALLEQEAILNRIGRPAAPGAPVAPGAAGGAAGVAPPAGGPADLGSVVGALAAIQGKLDEVKDTIASAVRDDTRQTTGAIKGLSDRVMR